MAKIEHTTQERLRREEAAQRLREIADDLARHNSIAFVREGVRYTIEVPNEVDFVVEIEVGDDESEIELTLEWRAT